MVGKIFTASLPLVNFMCSFRALTAKFASKIGKKIVVGGEETYGECVTVDKILVVKQRLEYKIRKNINVRPRVVLKSLKYTF